MTRPETGPMKFGDDWRGAFIRGEHALFYAHELVGHIAALAVMQPGLASSGAVMNLRALVRLLASVNDGVLDVPVQRLRPFGECEAKPTSAAPSTQGRRDD